MSETSNLGLPVGDGPARLDALTTILHPMAGHGFPVRGICWYSRGDRYDWDSALTAPVGKVTEVGLYDTERRANFLVAFRASTAPFPVMGNTPSEQAPPTAIRWCEAARLPRPPKWLDTDHPERERTSAALAWP
jgi:hypothetical protein